MSANVETQTADSIARAGDSVVAYVSNDSIPVVELPDPIHSIHTDLNGLASRVAPMPADAAPENPTAARIRRSVTPDGIVSVLDGESSIEPEA